MNTEFKHLLSSLTNNTLNIKVCQSLIILLFYIINSSQVSISPLLK